ncbi:MAG: hypothetical protein C0508_14130 [Cyanobacteria bacterium PR.023]|nr:hypothetical protein [Cyanobacteria bacterium PR.023]
MSDGSSNLRTICGDSAAYSPQIDPTCYSENSADLNNSLLALRQMMLKQRNNHDYNFDRHSADH